MRFYADFHIHSHYSLATSKQLNPEFLDFWSKIKGLSLIGTGDFTHPEWCKELKKKLTPAEEGLFKLKKSYLINEDIIKTNFTNKQTRFILTAEISSIYKKNGKVRKVHNVILAPDFKTVTKIQKALQKIGGNITSDGRPILGLDCQKLLEICLSASPDIFLIPAHIWTPWFSALGAKSGFDSIKECFGNLSKYIYAVETGLSTDAPMHWQCSFLDKYTLLSNSDAHSPEKLGRNANIFNTKMTYPDIIRAIKTANNKTFLGTIDLFPQEGKYHYAGHRKCGICLNPNEALKNNNICPVCKKQVTQGVMDRILQLSDRKKSEERKNRLPFHSIIPLKEVLSEINSVGANSKKIHTLYMNTIENLGNELDILLTLPIKKISDHNKILAEAIKRMRNKDIIIKEGFDGEFGVIKVFTDNETSQIKSKTFKPLSDS